MRTLRLLVIGNSLAENPLTHLQDISASTGQLHLVIGHATLGGCSLAKHWRLAEYTAQHPEYKTYQFDLGGGATPGAMTRAMNLQEALAAEPWDIVTLNQASIPGPRIESFRPWLPLLHGMVRELAPNAEIMLNQTWAYREDAPYLIEKGLTSDSMYERLRANYAHYANELGCRVIPTGEAIQRFRRMPDRRFSFPDPDFDYVGAQAPALPRQDNSLSVGWYWSINDSPDGIPQLLLDFNHLNSAGAYLAGCVWLESLSSIDARTATFIPGGVTADLAGELRELAHAVCTRS